MTRFPCILADPAWPADDRGSRIAPSHASSTRAKQYDVMSIEQICNLPVLDLADDDAFLFLWAPNYVVLEGWAAEVAYAWGFEAKQQITWIKVDANGKPRIGAGHYCRNATEQLVLCRRGKAKVKVRNEPNIIVAPRLHHSRKPSEQYLKIQRLCAGPYLELFARERWSPAWTVWGNEIDSDQEVAEAMTGGVQ